MTNVFPDGICSCEIDNNYQYLAFGSFVQDSSKNNSYCSINGISLWRFVNSEPWLQVNSLNDFLNDKNKIITSKLKIKSVRYFMNFY